MRRRHVKLLPLLGLVLAAISLSVAASRPAAREIVLVARGMAFYLPEDPATPNPALTVAPGETVRLTLINRDPGMRHDWAVETLGLATRMLPGDGASDTVAFEAPTRTGRHDYVCSTHSQLMRGSLEVR